MGKKITDEERQRIADLLPTGKSCREIAREVGRAPSTVGRVAREEEHTFGHLNLLRAHEARREYGKERRADFVGKLHEKAEGLLEHFQGDHLVYNFGGRDNEYNEHVLSDPPVDVKVGASKAIQMIYRTILEVLKYDNPRDGTEVGSDFDEWLAQKFGGPEQ